MDLTIWNYSSGFLSNYFEFKYRSANITPTNLADGVRGDYKKIKAIAVDRKAIRA